MLNYCASLMSGITSGIAVRQLSCAAVRARFLDFQLFSFFQGFCCLIPSIRFNVLLGGQVSPITSYMRLPAPNLKLIPNMACVLCFPIPRYSVR